MSCWNLSLVQMQLLSGAVCIHDEDLMYLNCLDYLVNFGTTRITCLALFRFHFFLVLHLVAHYYVFGTTTRLQITNRDVFGSFAGTSKYILCFSYK